MHLTWIYLMFHMELWVHQMLSNICKSVHLLGFLWLWCRPPAGNPHNKTVRLLEKYHEVHFSMSSWLWCSPLGGIPGKQTVFFVWIDAFLWVVGSPVILLWYFLSVVFVYFVFSVYCPAPADISEGAHRKHIRRFLFVFVYISYIKNLYIYIYIFILYKDTIWHDGWYILA